MGKSVKRLYDQFHPTNYKLSLHPDKEKMTFSGKVVISGKKVGRPSQRLTFHQRGLTVTKAVLRKQEKQGTSEILIDRINTQEKLTEVRLHASQMLYPGEYTIEIEFRGKVTTQMHGLYPCFFEHEGKEKILLATQFESHYARDVFPCIDEPEAKATFDLTLTTPKGETALSNTPIKDQKTNNNKQITTFETTPVMSTYLLAFVAGELHSVEGKTRDGVTVRSWSAISRPKQDLQYSVNEAVKILEFFTDYFGTPYPLEKCDQVALPDFDAGAMENWGLITYREIALLADPVNRSVSNEQYISLVVAHELSHQWFGNLVTMKWWDDLWLNESFASLMEYIALDAIHPDWHVWEMYTSSDVVSTSSRDVYSEIQPVGVVVTDPDLIDTLFDPGIVYAKGGRLLKMLREYIGEDVFVQGLHTYFKKHAYANASRDDLWEALSSASGKDILSLMNSWLTKPGMPVLHVSQKAKSLHLSQERFMLDKPADSSLWPVPLLADKSVKPDVFSEKSIEITLPDDEFRVINHKASGHYFVDYEEAAHRQYLAERFRNGGLVTESRINLLNDIFMLSRHGDASLTEGMELFINALDEPRDSVWELVLRLIMASTQLTEGDKTVEAELKKLRRYLAQNWYEKLGWDHGKDDDPNTRQLRHTIVALMTAGEDEHALSQAKGRYSAAKDPKDIDAELRNTILAANVRHKTPGVVGALIKAYPNASSDVQMDITGALASTKESEIARDALHKALGEKGFVRDQDVMRWIASFLRNHHIRDVAWDYLTKNWDWFEKTLGKSKSFDFLPIYCAGVMNTPEGLEKFKQLFDDKQHIKVLQHNIKVGIADIEARIDWRKREEPKIKQWLNSWSKGQPKNS